MHTFANPVTLLGGLVLLLLPAITNSCAINATSTEHLLSLHGTKNGANCPANNTLMTPECPCLTVKRDNSEHMQEGAYYRSFISPSYTVQVKHHSIYVAPHSWTFGSSSNRELLMNSIKAQALKMLGASATKYCASLLGTQEWRLYDSQFNGWRVRDWPDDSSTRLLRSAMAGWSSYGSVEFSGGLKPEEVMFEMKIGVKGHIAEVLDSSDERI